MATFSFAGPAGGVSGFGGGGSIWGSDWGRPWATGMQAGFDVNQMFRQLNAQNELDPSILAATKAQADAQRLNADILSSQAEGQLAGIFRQLKKNGADEASRALAPQDPETAAITAANDQAMQDQAMQKFANPLAARAVFGDQQAQFDLNQMLRLPQYERQLPLWGAY